MITLHPPRSEHDRFATKLEPGEAQLRDRIVEILEPHSAEWHLWVQPYALNLRPDFLVGSADHGVCVIEVKDWNPSGLRARNGRLTVNGERISADPLAQLARYREMFSNHLIARPGETVFPLIGATLAAPRMPTGGANEIFREGTAVTEAQARYLHVAGNEVFSDLDQFWAFINGGGRMSALNGATFRRLVQRLQEPLAAADQRRDLVLRGRAAVIAENREGATTRRVRGSAGSGKTMALAARAAELASDGKRVLVLTFNITLAHYVQDLVRRRARVLRADPRLVDCIHFHGFCASITGKMSVTDPDDYIRRAMELYVGDEHRQLPRYDAILVDEGQDFEVEWWRFLRQHVRATDSSEMLFCYDEAQMLYARGGWNDETSMTGLGFRQWMELSGCYRMPADMIPTVRSFTSAYLDLPSDALPSLPEGAQQLSLRATLRRWINCEPDEAPARILQAVTTLVDRDGISPADVTVLADHETGEVGMDLLAEAGQYVEHVFAPTKEVQQRRKNAFWPGTAAVKGSTIHSFKGWESTALVVVVEHTADRPGAPKPELLLYVALTRLRGELELDRPSSVFVINCVRYLDGFAETFQGLDPAPVLDAWPLAPNGDLLLVPEDDPQYRWLLAVPPPEDHL